jgi:uncharacterized protein
VVLVNVSDIVIAGDTPGVSYRIPVLRFSGSNSGAPKVYMQAALHAGELPGTAALHFLCQQLRIAEECGEIAGDITIVPQANPYGTAQWFSGEMQGRFDLNSRVNFNREFPLISFDDRDALLVDIERRPAVEQIKRRLMRMAFDADIVLDQHCDDESLQYAYLEKEVWPEAADLATALAMDAVLIADGESSAFDEAIGYAWKRDSARAEGERFRGRLVTTVELRGWRDVDAGLARKDADGLMAFLKMRGVVSGSVPNLPAFNGPVTPLDHIEMIRAPQAGTILFHREPGDTVAAGDVLVTLITAPGMAGGTLEVTAPQAGLVVTRVSKRFTAAGGDLMKIASAGPSTRQRKPGALEN